ncbi:type II secretion system protein [Caulobacter segnis]
MRTRRCDQLGVTDHDTLRAKLASLPSVEGLPWPADADAARGWRTCAGALVSFYGAADFIPTLAYVEPDAGKDDSKWRAGEAWRIAITDEDGWRDERIVRFTGNGLNPAAIISRRLSRGWKDNSGMRNPARRRLKGSDGYTLTEMLVVVGIIALIAAVLVPNLMNQMQRSRAKAARIQLDNVASAVEAFKSDTGHYPSTAEGA